MIIISLLITHSSKNKGSALISLIIDKAALILLVNHTVVSDNGITQNRTIENVFYRALW